MFVNIPFLHGVNYWFAPFIFGMYISKYNLFARILNLCDTALKRVSLSILLIVVSLCIRVTFLQNKVYFDAFFAFAIILFSYMVLSSIPKLSKCFEILGKHSANILVLVCLLISVVLEKIKKAIKYNHLMQKLTFV